MTNSISELEDDTDAIFVIGSNTTENHPVIGMKIIRAVKRGAKLIVADPRKTELSYYAEISLHLRPGTDVALVNGMMNVIIKEGLADESFIRERTEGYEEFKAVIEKYTPEYAEEITGVKAEDIIKAARLFGNADHGSIVYAMGLTQHSTGTDNVLTMANLSMLTGNLGKPGVGVNPLRGQNNVQGACDMGALPNVFTAYQPVANDDARAKFEKAWGVSLDGRPGLTLTDAMNEAYNSKVKSMVIIGENPMMSDPDLHHVEESLKKLDFLVVSDIFLTETARLADVVFPAASFAEKEGTFSNTERRVQMVRKAVSSPGESKTDMEIICLLSTKMGYPMTYSSPEEVFEEIRALTPSYAGMSYARLQGKGLQWPCPNEEHPGTAFLHKDKCVRGLGLFSPVEFIPPAELPDYQYPFYLTTGRILYHYHTGTMTRRSKAINEFYPDPFIEINQDKAKAMGIGDGDQVRLTTRRGSLVARAKLMDNLHEDTIFMTFHFSEAAANILTNAVLDPVAKIPEYKVSAAKLEKI